MYVPEHFAVRDSERLAALIAGHGFATLVTVAEGAPFASHLPMIHDAGRGPLGTLRAHMARANPQWRHFEGGAEVLVVFHGPHGYVSPTWYATEIGVPTWNYAAVHTTGVARVIEERPAVESLLRDLVAAHDPAPREAWPESDDQARMIASMIPQIVAFEIPISGLEGKFKLSQNRDQGDRERVIAQLEASTSTTEQGLAALMKEGTGED